MLRMTLAGETSGKAKDREGSSRSERHKARTATAIRDAAERLFIGRGYSATTMEDLAEEADVAVGSIYAHFGSKEGVYGALIERALELDKRYCDEGFHTGNLPAERLFGLAEGYLRFAREHPGYFQLFRFPPPDRPGAELTPTASARVARRIKDETKRMAGAIQLLIDAGIGRPVDAESTARFLWAAWDGVICSHVGPSNMGLTDKQFEAVLDRAREGFALSLLALPDPDPDPGQEP
jgi:TetR/AcrR family transcriptional regulator